MVGDRLDVGFQKHLGLRRVERSRDHLEPEGWVLPADEEGVADRRCALELGEDSRRDAEVDIVDPPPLPGPRGRVDEGGEVGGEEAVDQTARREQASEVVQRRSEKHTSELQSLMRISYAVFCLKKKNHTRINYHRHTT